MTNKPRESTQLDPAALPCATHALNAIRMARYYMRLVVEANVDQATADMLDEADESAGEAEAILDHVLYEVKGQRMRVTPRKRKKKVSP